MARTLLDRGPINRERVSGRTRFISQLTPVLGITILLFLSWIAGITTDSTSTGIAAHSRSYSPHSPIVIESDSELAAGGWPGDGSEANPYLIAGYDIDATGSNAGISISNVTFHFKVSDCYVHSGPKYGMYLVNVTHAKVSDNNFSDNYRAGVLISNGNNTLVDNNSCYNNGDNIWVLYSEYVMISNNTCLKGSIGIELADAENCTAIRNNCSSLGIGISVSGKGNNTISENDCWLETGTGIHLLSTHNNTIRRNNCSAANPILTLGDGIFLTSSDDNTIADNSLLHCRMWGIYITGTGNVIWNNTLVGNNGAGATYDPFHVQACDDGSNNRWNLTGWGNWWSDWQSPDLNGDGIVDIEYSVAGTSNAKDFYPLTTPGQPQIPEFGSLSIAFIAGATALIACTAVKTTRARRLNR